MAVIKNLSGVFAATDILMGQKPFYEKPKQESKDNGFQKLLDEKIAELKKKGG